MIQHCEALWMVVHDCAKAIGSDGDQTCQGRTSHFGNAVPTPQEEMYPDQHHSVTRGLLDQGRSGESMRDGHMHRQTELLDGRIDSLSAIRRAKKIDSHILVLHGLLRGCENCTLRWAADDQMDELAQRSPGGTALKPPWATASHFTLPYGRHS